MRTTFSEGEDWAHQHVIAILSERLCREVSAKDRLVDLSLDSLDIVEIVMALEDEFGIESDDSQIERLETVQDLIDLVRRSKD